MPLRPDGKGGYIYVPDEDGGPTSVPVGTLKTLGGRVYEWDGDRWSDTGYKDEKAPGAPNVEFDSSGRAYYWGTGTQGQPAPIYLGPDFDNPTKAAGYRAPSNAAPPLPHTYPDPRTGDIVGTDPRTGAELYRIKGATWATISPQDQEAIRQGDIDRARAWSVQDKADDRAFTTGENDRTRGFTREQNDIDRGIRAGEFAQTYGLNAAQFEANQNQFEANFNRQKSKDAVDTARQYADLISTVDPNAFDAFLRSGGGVIGNSIAAGNTAVSERAALPAARTRMALDGINASSFNRTQLPAYGAQNAPVMSAAHIGQYAAGGWNPNDPNLPTISTGNPQLDATLTSDRLRGGNAWLTHNYAAGGAIPAYSAPATVPSGQPNAGSLAATDAGRAQANQNMDNAKVPSWVPRFAGGGFTQAPMMQVGDSPSGAPTGNEEVVINPTGAPIMVMPNRRNMPMIPRFAEGTFTAGMPGSEITQADRPYIDDVMNFRRNAIVPDYNPFDVQFRNVNPFTRASFFAGRQTRYGIPVAASEFEAQRFAVPGQSRGIMAAQGY